MEPAMCGKDPTQFDSCKMNYPACSSVCNSEEQQEIETLRSFSGLFPSGNEKQKKKSF
jgi:hypothetical protein